MRWTNRVNTYRYLSDGGHRLRRAPGGAWPRWAISIRPAQILHPVSTDMISATRRTCLTFPPTKLGSGGARNSYGGVVSTGEITTSTRRRHTTRGLGKLSWEWTGWERKGYIQALYSRPGRWVVTTTSEMRARIHLGRVARARKGEGAWRSGPAWRRLEVVWCTLLQQRRVGPKCQRIRARWGGPIRCFRPRHKVVLHFPFSLFFVLFPFVFKFQIWIWIFFRSFTFESNVLIRIFMERKYILIYIFILSLLHSIFLSFLDF
jgi:hypothetical protein